MRRGDTRGGMRAQVRGRDEVPVLWPVSRVWIRTPIEWRAIPRRSGSRSSQATFSSRTHLVSHSPTPSILSGQFFPPFIIIFISLFDSEREKKRKVLAARFASTNTLRWVSFRRPGAASVVGADSVHVSDRHLFRVL
jgi:hypothetical protein